MGTPVPKINEAGTGSSDLKVYQLSEEEHAKYKKKAAYPNKVSFTLEEYLQKRLNGQSRTEVMRTAGIHPPDFYAWLAHHNIKEMAIENFEISKLREKLQKNADPDGPRTPTQQEREEMFAPEQDKQPAAEPKAEATHNYLQIQIPLVQGDHVGSYGMQVQERYERFGEHIDFTHLDRGLVFRELLQLNQAVLSWLQFDIGQLVVDEAERTSTLLKFIEHHNKNHIEEVLQKAKQNGWEVLQG